MRRQKYTFIAVISVVIIIFIYVSNALPARESDATTSFTLTGDTNVEIEEEVNQNERTATDPPSDAEQSNKLNLYGVAIESVQFVSDKMKAIDNNLLSVQDAFINYVAKLFTKKKTDAPQPERKEILSKIVFSETFSENTSIGPYVEEGIKVVAEYMLYIMESDDAKKTMKNIFDGPEVVYVKGQDVDYNICLQGFRRQVKRTSNPILRLLKKFLNGFDQSEKVVLSDKNLSFLIQCILTLQKISKDPITYHGFIRVILPAVIEFGEIFFIPKYKSNLSHIKQFIVEELENFHWYMDAGMIAPIVMSPKVIVPEVKSPITELTSFVFKMMNLALSTDVAGVIFETATNLAANNKEDQQAQDHADLLKQGRSYLLKVSETLQKLVETKKNNPEDLQYYDDLMKFMISDYGISAFNKEKIVAALKQKFSQGHVEVAQFLLSKFLPLLDSGTIEKFKSMYLVPVEIIKITGLSTKETDIVGVFDRLGKLAEKKWSPRYLALFVPYVKEAAKLVAQSSYSIVKKYGDSFLFSSDFILDKLRSLPKAIDEMGPIDLKKHLPVLLQTMSMLQTITVPAYKLKGSTFIKNEFLQIVRFAEVFNPKGSIKLNDFKNFIEESVCKNQLVCLNPSLDDDLIIEGLPIFQLPSTVFFSNLLRNVLNTKLAAKIFEALEWRVLNILDSPINQDEANIIREGYQAMVTLSNAIPSISWDRIMDRVTQSSSSTEIAQILLFNLGRDKYEEVSKVFKLIGFMGTEIGAAVFKQDIIIPNPSKEHFLDNDELQLVEFLYSEVINFANCRETSHWISTYKNKYAPRPKEIAMTPSNKERTLEGAFKSFAEIKSKISHEFFVQHIRPYVKEAIQAVAKCMIATTASLATDMDKIVIPHNKVSVFEDHRPNMAIIMNRINKGLINLSEKGDERSVSTHSLELELRILSQCISSLEGISQPPTPNDMIKANTKFEDIIYRFIEFVDHFLPGLRLQVRELKSFIDFSFANKIWNDDDTVSCLGEVSHFRAHAIMFTELFSKVVHNALNSRVAIRIIDIAVQRAQANNGALGQKHAELIREGYNDMKNIFETVMRLNADAIQEALRTTSGTFDSSLSWFTKVVLFVVKKKALEDRFISFIQFMATKDGAFAFDEKAIVADLFTFHEEKVQVAQILLNEWLNVVGCEETAQFVTEYLKMNADEGPGASKELIATDDIYQLPALSVPSASNSVRQSSAAGIGMEFPLYPQLSSKPGMAGESSGGQGNPTLDRIQ